MPVVSAFPTSASGLVWGETVGPEVNLGMLFRCEQAGKFAGMRWFRNALENPFLIGKLFSSTGSRLGMWTWLGDEGPFVSGGSWVNLWAHPRVPLLADTLYFAVMYAVSSGYWVHPAGMQGVEYQNGPLVVPASTTELPQMWYSFANVASIPTSTFNHSRYGIDVLFDYR